MLKALRQAKMNSGVVAEKTAAKQLSLFNSIVLDYM